MQTTIAQLGEPVLKTPASPVTRFDDSLKQLADSMMQLMSEAGGVGIAAPQVFEPLQVIIVASRPNDRYPDAPEMKPVVMVNPEITERSGEWSSDWEGCLSVPGIRGLIRRRHQVTVIFQDLSGNQHTLTLTGFPARILQHEMDHLAGKTFVDRVASNQDLIATSVWLQRVADQQQQLQS